MAYPEHLLARGERIVLHKHPHWKVLALPVLAFVIVVGGGSALAAWVGHWRDAGFTSHTPWYIGIVVVGVILLVWWVLVPFLRWGTEHFVISTAHVFFRTGILRRREHQIPLSRIQNLETEVTFWGRLLGFGSLIVESAADQPLEFENVASLSKVQATLNQLIADDRGHRGFESNDGMGSAGGPGDSWSGDDAGYPEETAFDPAPGADPDFPGQGHRRAQDRRPR
ncbi:MAG: PH domain-containing protein [Williamsia herbipolensis]|nr:PH domain-containing protein [Williamsia herbipolensis]